MIASRNGPRVPWWGVVMALALARAPSVFASGPTSSCPLSRTDSATLTNRWAPPLDRPVTVHATDISLRDALDRIAASAHLRMSYNTEQLPLTRAVCLNADAQPAGRVFADLLSSTNVTAIGVGGDQVVLAPRRESPTHAEPSSGMASAVGLLDRVVVTGSANATGAPARELSIGLTVIDGEQLQRDNTSTIAGALDSYVPGVWGWAQSPSTLVSSYASIRGASSFGLSYPKVYIDGIEVANPLLLSRFNPASIDRIEVIRGPQGSALYGTDAISGVVNIVTRHEGASPDGSRAQIRSTAGLSQSNFANDVLAQDHSISFATGTSARSADLDVAIGSMGSFVPNGYSRDLMATGSTRVVREKSTFSATGRLFIERAGSPDSPLLGHPMRAPGDTNPLGRDVPQSVSEYTLGTSATSAMPNDWTLSAVTGIDGYRLSHVQTNFTPIPSVLDSALRAAEGGADRATIRLSGVRQFNAGALTHGTLTLAAEQSAMRVSSVPMQIQEQIEQVHAETTRSQTSMTSMSELPASMRGDRVETWQNSTGLVTQGNFVWNDRVFATAGVRFEHDSRLMADPIETLPMLGIATVFTPGDLTLKLRASFGKGMRPPSTPSRMQFWQTQTQLVAQSLLGPERQTGYEAGIDVSLRNLVSIQATRFDQRASGLIQPVGIPIDSMERSHRMIYFSQNVGEISNTGWEVQANATLSSLTLVGTLSLVDSRVRKLADGYTGDLYTGGRMLQVPARTESFNATWNALRWRATIGASRALDWINYDALALTQAVASQTHLARDFAGPRLRDYWKIYDGGTRLRAALSRDIRDQFAIEISAENLLNHQTGEPDNVTVIPGRTLMTGLRLKF